MHINKSEVLAVIMAREGSVGLPNKNFRPLLGKPVLAYSIEHALQCSHVGRVVVTSDAAEAARLCQEYGVQFLQRPEHLCRDDVMAVKVYRHALRTLWALDDSYKPTVVATMYGNVPVRPAGGTDAAIEMLVREDADSVQSVEDVGSHHPFWARRLMPDGQLQKFINMEGDYYTRQSLPPVYVLNGAITVCRTELIMHQDATTNAGFHLGTRRYGLRTHPHECVDIDCLADFYLAEAVLRAQQPQPAPLQDGYPCDHADEKLPY